jgi:MoaA/NifB/PqqE/SkfB family radical SAM enzyme
MVFWEVTRACDLVCRHCRAEAQPMRHPAELSLPEVLRVLDDLEIASNGRTWRTLPGRRWSDVSPSPSPPPPPPS